MNGKTINDATISVRYREQSSQPVFRKSAGPRLGAESMGKHETDSVVSDYLMSCERYLGVYHVIE